MIANYVLLYRTAEDWRMTVHLGDDGIACGPLHEVAASAPFSEGAAAAMTIVRREFGPASEPRWVPSELDHWSADLGGAGT